MVSASGTVHGNVRWYGVDLDATLFEYHEWVAWNKFGVVIPRMRDRVVAWLSKGEQVRIVTARVGLPTYVHPTAGPVYSQLKTNRCVVTGEMFSDEDMVRAVHAHLLDNAIPLLWVQCFKDYNMIELWDDRAVQMVPNTGRTLAEEHAAVLATYRADDAAKVDVYNGTHAFPDEN